MLYKASWTLTMTESSVSPSEQWNWSPSLNMELKHLKDVNSIKSQHYDFEELGFWPLGFPFFPLDWRVLGILEVWVLITLRIHNK